MTDIISAHIENGLEPVRDAFKANFDEGLEVGASVCIIKDDQIIAKLHGGHTTRSKDTLWSDETLVPVYSCTKLVCAIIIAHLADQDKLGYSQKVASLWPDFAQNGKGDLTIGQVLSHQSGLSGITDPDFTNMDWFDWDKTCAALAAQEPIWEPGTASGYHPITFGNLVGEIARRADGRTIGAILREDFALPHNLDFHIGTPEPLHGRCADLVRPKQIADLGEINDATRAAFLQKSSAPYSKDMTAWRKAEFPASNGHGSAMSLARIATVLLDGKLNGMSYLSEDLLHAVAQTQISGPNLVLPFDLTFAAGVMKNTPNSFFGPVESTLGHSGWGGSCVFADQVHNLTFAYVMNKQSHHLIGDPRPTRIIEALYSCL